MAAGAAPHALRLALRALRRGWRAGELRLLIAALVIAVGSITAVGFFTDRMERGMQLQARELLAADLVLASPRPIDPALAAAARERGLRTARTLSFRSVVVRGERLQLAEVKAVSRGYPLRGTLHTADAPFAPGRPVVAIPRPGSAWTDARLTGVLDLEPGDTLQLGRARLRMTRVLSYEPDRGGDLFSIAPRLLMNLGDVARTALVQPGSRVSYRLLVAGPEAQVAAYRAWLEGRLAADQHLHGLRDARPEMRAALDRAGRFLGLAALVSVLLAGVAIAVCARRYARRHQDTAAVMRCLGAGQRLVGAMYAWQLLALALLGGIGGCALGYAAQAGLAALLGSLLAAQLPPPSPAPALLGLAAGVLTLAGFALPPLLRLRGVPPLRVLRRDLGALPPRAWSVYGAALATITALIFWYAQDPRLGAWVVAGAAGTLAVLAAGSTLLVRSLAGLRGRVGVAWRFGLASIARSAGGSRLQVMSFGLGIMVLLLLAFVRTGLLEQWRDSLPADAPNYFLINIQPDEVEAVRRFLAGHDLPAVELHPMVRGRLAAIDGREVVAEDYAEPRAQRLAAREFNLSWARRVHPGNRVAAGRWWEDGDRAAQFSVEQGLAQTLGIELGDALTFQVAGQTVSGRVSSLREVAWDSFRVNFFVLAPPGVLEGFPATWITSFHLPRTRTAVLAELVQRFPSVTVIDVDALMARVRELMERATLAVEYVFAFTLLAGLMVLYAGIQSTLDERRFETAVVRTLGAARRRLLQGLIAEFATLGVLSGLLGALAATITANLLATRVFGLALHVDPRVWLAGVLVGAIGVTLAGVLGTRRVLDEPPLSSLRRLA